ncbi:hypothetical protein A4X13_0g5524 [Tilletia indica]|uniref:Uncharacterized protein n=1 Tax=Tilletia indica TaxID=43049 RepID=A0A177TVH7_9BASI|nr:hypothetical protein A4X13_0g5524 [Tilletia indica]
MASPQFASHPSRSYVYPTATDTSTTSTPPASASASSPSTTTTAAASHNRYASLPSRPPSGSSPSSSTSGRPPPSVVRKNRAASSATLTADDKPAAPLNAVLQAFAVTLALQYASAALAMPFEVAKLLLQVQYLPTPSTKSADDSKGTTSQQHTAQQAPPHPDHAADDPTVDPQEEDEAYAGEARHWGGEFDELSDEEEAVAYFQDLSSQPLRPPTSRRGVAGAAENNRPTDAAGYIDPSASATTSGSLTRSSRAGRVDDDADALRPEWVFPRVWDGGVWGMMKTISRSREGFLGLWKGTFASFLLEAGSGFFQPLFAQILAFLTRQPSLILSLPPSYSPSPYVSLSIQLASHLCTGLLLSPLDTVRTRLVAQSGLRAHRTYKSTWHAFTRMLNEEGGWRTAYFHPNVLIPTVLDYSLRPLLSMGAPLVIERWLGIEATNSPALYAAAELTLGTASLLVSLPIETVRRRLQLQRRAAWGVLPKPVVAGALPAPIPLDAPAATADATSAKAKTSSTAPHHTTGRDLTPFPAFVPPNAVGTSTLGIRTSVEVRPVAYAGVIEAMYRIVTEECGRRSHGHGGHGATSHTASAAASSAAADSSAAAAEGTEKKKVKKDIKKKDQTQMENAIVALSDLFGGLKSLYRGFGLAAAANGVVFVLTVVGGENARSASGFGHAGSSAGMGAGSFAGGGWTEI